MSKVPQYDNKLLFVSEILSQEPDYDKLKNLLKSMELSDITNKYLCRCNGHGLSILQLIVLHNNTDLINYTNENICAINAGRLHIFPLDSFDTLSAQLGIIRKKSIKMLSLVNNPSIELCKALIPEYKADVLKYIKNPTEEICLEILRYDGMALAYIQLQTENMCLEAVKQNGMALKYAHYKTDKIIQEATKQDILATAYADASNQNIYSLLNNKQSN